MSGGDHDDSQGADPHPEGVVELGAARRSDALVVRADQEFVDVGAERPVDDLALRGADVLEQPAVLGW